MKLFEKANDKNMEDGKAKFYKKNQFQKKKETFTLENFSKTFLFIKDLKLKSEVLGIII